MEDTKKCRLEDIKKGNKILQRLYFSPSCCYFYLGHCLLFFFFFNWICPALYICYKRYLIALKVRTSTNRKLSLVRINTLNNYSIKTLKKNYWYVQAFWEWVDCYYYHSNNHYDWISMIQASSCQQESIVSVLSDAPIEQ